MTSSTRLASPEKRRFDVISGHPMSPSALKRQRLMAPSSISTLSPDAGLRELDLFTIDSDGSPMDPSQQQLLDEETHGNRLMIQDQMISGKGTEIAYARHLKNYCEFWDADQEERLRRDPKWNKIPAEPITVRNAALFLQYETTRTKRTSDGQDIVGTRVGQDSIKQCISALEHWRYNHQHQTIYRNCPASHIPLRDDIRITAYEKHAQATEPERLAESQSLKATGALSDTYTQAELIRGSMLCLQSTGSSKSQVHLGTRDRAMLLISTCTAYRGNNTRGLLLSDLAVRDIPMVDIGPDAKVMALVLMTDHGKTNTTGRIDLQGAFRHRIPELCSIGALGFYFFSWFHILGSSPPDFAPNFTKGGEYGHRSWYDIFLFPGAKGENTEMTYQNHRKRIHHIHSRADIDINKVTHAGRSFTVIQSREHRATSDDTKALGGWNADSYWKCYDRVLPSDAMLAAASFNGRKQDSYFVARDLLEPPTNIVEGIFPWVEQEQLALKQRRELSGKRAVDNTLAAFLDLLVRLRKIILQDAALLVSKYPDCPIFSYAPFNTPQFAMFAASAALTLERAEEEARHRLSLIPENMAHSLRGIIETSQIQQAQSRQDILQQNTEVTAHFESIGALLHTILLGSNSKRKKAVASLLSAKANAPHLAPEPAQALVSGSDPHSRAPLRLPSAPPSHGISPASQVSTPPASPATGPLLPIGTPVNDPILSPHATVALSGNTYSVGTFKLSADPYERSKQLTAITNLENKFDVERLRNHHFDWTRLSSESKEDEWLPVYTYWTPEGQGSPSITEIWTEWMFGIDKHLSVRELTAEWSARWRRNNGKMKTEASRRKKIIDLVETLSKKTNWNSTLALRFLSEHYPIPTRDVPHLRTTRAFIDFLQRKNGGAHEEIYRKADLYAK